MWQLPQKAGLDVTSIPANAPSIRSPTIQERANTTLRHRAVNDLIKRAVLSLINAGIR